MSQCPHSLNHWTGCVTCLREYAGAQEAEVERLRALVQTKQDSEAMLVTERKNLKAEVERLRVVERAARDIAQYPQTWAGDPMYMTVLRAALKEEA